MSIRPIDLRSLLELAPVCWQTEPLSAVVDLFRQGTYDRVVVVNRQRQPVGVIHLRSLMPHLLPVDGSALNLSQPLSALTSPCLDPLPTLPIDLPLDECLPYLTAGPRLWALMDRDRAFQGLLDGLYLQKLLGMSAPANAVARAAEFDVDELGLGGAGEPTLNRHDYEAVWGHDEVHLQQRDEVAPRLAPLDIDRFKTQLRLQISRLRAQVEAQQALVDHLEQKSPYRLPLDHEPELSRGANPAGRPSAAVTPPIATLIQFLQRLPLPLMLQTNRGEILVQNSVWSQQFAELVDPSWLQREAAVHLEPDLTGREWQDTAAGWQQPAEPDPVTAVGLCHLGATPNTCICICPYKNGQERIVQFIKIPLGDLSPEIRWELTEPWQRVEEQSSHRFRLAQLETNPLTAGSDEKPVTPGESLWLVLAQDVTEQQQLAKELAAKNADLVQLNRLKDEFLACISHELRTPLTAMLGLSSLLKDQLVGGLNDRQLRYAQLIYRSGRHLMAIVNDILDLTRMETGQVELTPEPINIPQVCQRAFEQAKQIRLMEAKPDTQQAEADLLPTPPFALELEPGLESLVADEVRLRQMLVNLLSNALKFTEVTGAIGLRVSRWDGWVAFTVWDTGIGIPADKQHLIFQKFQQLENPLTRRFEGAGLGLVLTQRLARLHGGDVTFVSKEHRGSQFTLLLPPAPVLSRSQADVMLGVLRDRQLPQPPNRLVLIVEAGVQFIEALTEQLTQLGYRVVIARSGTEAVEKTRRLQPCTIFLNPQLPMLSGWDVLTLLKADAETRHIPVIITTAHLEQEQAYRNPADGVLSLPIVPAALQQTLARFANPTAVTSSPPVESLVVMRLSPDRYSSEHPAFMELNNLLHQHNYRVLEVDDLEQADVIAQVWQPHVVILAGVLAEPAVYLKQLAEHPALAALPLVTLDRPTTQAANQIPGLLVFPCLAPLAEQFSSLPPETSALLQVIQVAAGVNGKGEGVKG